MVKTEVFHLSRNPDQRVLQVNELALKKVDKCKYLEVKFTRDERLDKDPNTPTGKASAVMRALPFKHRAVAFPN